MTQELIRKAIKALDETTIEEGPIAANYLRMGLAIIEFGAARVIGKKLVFTDEDYRTVENLPIGPNGFILKGAGSDISGNPLQPF